MRQISFKQVIPFFKRPVVVQVLLLAVCVISMRIAAQQQTPTQQVPQNAAVISGVVQDGGGLPLDKVTVLLTAPNVSASVLTTPEGKFEFKNLAPAAYVVTVQATRFRKIQKTV